MGSTPAPAAPPPRSRTPAPRSRGDSGLGPGSPVVGAEPRGDLLPAAGSASARACWPRTATSPPASPRGPASARGLTCLTIRTPDSAPHPQRRRRPSVCSSPAPPAPAPLPLRCSPRWRLPPCRRPASRCTAPACWRRASPLVSGPWAGLQGAPSTEWQWELERPALQRLGPAAARPCRRALGCWPASLHSGALGAGLVSGTAPQAPLPVSCGLAGPSAGSALAGPCPARCAAGH